MLCYLGKHLLQDSSVRSLISDFSKLTAYQTPKFEHPNSREENRLERKVFIRFAPGGLERRHSQKEGGCIPVVRAG